MSDSKVDAKTVVRRLLEAMAAHDIEGACACAAEGLVNHSAIPTAQGRAGLRTIARKLTVAFPDMKVSIEDLIAEGDRVVARVVMSGTHTGPLDFVNMPLAPTGRSFRVDQIRIFRVQDGLIAEHWSCRDDLGMLKQLGLLSAKEAA